MSLGCLVCHHVESPSHSFRSYSVSSSENEGRCSSIIASCMSRMPHQRGGSATSIMASSKVTPQPTVTVNEGMPRLVRSHAVRRDIVRDWNFDQFEIVAA